MSRMIQAAETRMILPVHTPPPHPEMGKRPFTRLQGTGNQERRKCGEEEKTREEKEIGADDRI